MYLNLKLLKKREYRSGFSIFHFYMSEGASISVKSDYFLSFQNRCAQLRLLKNRENLHNPAGGTQCKTFSSFLMK